MTESQIPVSLGGSQCSAGTLFLQTNLLIFDFLNVNRGTFLNPQSFVTHCGF